MVVLRTCRALVIDWVNHVAYASRLTRFKSGMSQTSNFVGNAVLYRQPVEFLESSGGRRSLMFFGDDFGKTVLVALQLMKI